GTGGSGHPGDVQRADNADPATWDPSDGTVDPSRLDAAGHSRGANRAHRTGHPDRRGPDRPDSRHLGAGRPGPDHARCPYHADHLGPPRGQHS
ncbi:MAG TPA: hypothetical protein VEZ18_12665, partial [Geodermatophilus sp.]|nr:hypothetical protein [Geodermatophilus sp.]